MIHLHWRVTLKTFIHTSPTAWSLIWLSRDIFVLKDAPHIKQSRLRCPKWTNACFFKCDFWENCFLQWGHLNGFTPECTKVCLLRLSLLANPCLQYSHLNGLSPECVLWCLVIMLIQRVEYKQWWQERRPVASFREKWMFADKRTSTGKVLWYWPCSDMSSSINKNKGVNKT